METRIMTTGTVRAWKPEGYGFIARSDGSANVFVHQRDLRNAGYDYLVPTQRIEFDLQENRNKPGRYIAKNVRLLEPVLSQPMQRFSSAYDVEDPYTAHMDLAEVTFVKRRP
jgi:cold shock protein